MVKLFYYSVRKQPIHSVCEAHDVFYYQCWGILAVPDTEKKLHTPCTVPERQPDGSFNFLTKSGQHSQLSEVALLLLFLLNTPFKSVREAYHAFTSCPFSWNLTGTPRLRTAITGSRSDTEENVTMLPGLLPTLSCLFPVTCKHTKQQRQCSKKPGARALQKT